MTGPLPGGFAGLQGWADDDHLAAWRCFYRTAGAVPSPEPSTAAGARLFFETRFVPFSMGPGFVTAYFEPELPASPVRTDTYAVPLYAPPPDLVEIDPACRTAGLDRALTHARRTAAGLVEHPDRAMIENGALAGRGLEIAWLRHPVDAFFVHVQGSARLCLPDGTILRIVHAGRSGHPYTSIGRLLVDAGAVPAACMSMRTLRQWLCADAGRAAELMRRNRSYIFFRRVDPAPDLGPPGAAGVSLTPGRSLAVDRRLVPLGSPVWIATRQPFPGAARPLRRLLVAQDTGSAIVGAGRGDIFIGSGAAAGDIAGAVSHRSEFIVLKPRPCDNAAHER